MNLLMIGAGKGSWEIRGVQLGAALGARVPSTPTREDYEWADVIVLVKRAILRHGREAARSGKPIIWDVLDCWSQPAQNRMDEASAVAFMDEQRKAVGPKVLLCATQEMARALGGVYLPHHAWPDLSPAPVRPTVQTVAYEGNVLFLGAWQTRLERACARRGWRFVRNPSTLQDADILVAFRDGIWDGWLPRAWKSGVKVVNAVAAGRPLLTQSTAAFREIGAPGDIVETEAQLEHALEAWAHHDRRVAAAAACAQLAPAYRLETIAEQYRALAQRALETTCPT